MVYLLERNIVDIKNSLAEIINQAPNFGYILEWHFRMHNDKIR